MLGVLLFQTLLKQKEKDYELTVYKCKNRKHPLYFHCLVDDMPIDIFLDKEGNWSEMPNKQTELAEAIGKRIETKGK